ncbi:hypothetical protein T11_14698 [Trichinella zimbabwensis]|uniref:Uncharacterized protein n=1 Tax=Trichinella zimbabwensis TaxID=268475 RepID=A0A0V1HIM5_9BILA|nr:hypothetical protein T11_14698 [Trichinella zimbabwensis]
MKFSTSEMIDYQIDCFESSVCHSFTNFVALALSVINCEVKGSNTAAAFNRHSTCLFWADISFNLCAD